MYINKLIKKQVMLILATIVLVGTLAVTTSFAVFEETKSNATDQKMTIGDLDVTYTGGSAISITDINPMTDSTALSKTNNIYTFTIKNTGTVPYNFKVKVINNSSYTTNLLPHQYIRYSFNSGTASTLGTGQDDYELTSGVIEAGKTNTYTLRLWVADASTYKLPNSALGQEIHLKISVEGKAGSGWIPSNFKDRILALNEVKAPITTPGKEISSDSEALLASTQDDYGTSYYFRGLVNNNYVEFANKCWRIVRITGDNTIRLILHNNNSSGVSNPCSYVNNDSKAAFTSTNSQFNSTRDDNAYVGFMYGTAGSSDYASTHVNTNKSTILSYLETWYSSELESYSNKIANANWCIDKTNVTDTSYDINKFNPNGLGYGTNVTYYAATPRLIGNNSSGPGTGPTLKCLGEFSKIQNVIALLSADEAAFAGYSGMTSNNNNYLQENATGGTWFTLTPFNFSSGTSVVWRILGGSGTFFGGTVTYSGDVRPTISLLSTVTATGTGTSEDPYVVQ